MDLSCNHLVVAQESDFYLSFSFKNSKGFDPLRGLTNPNSKANVHG